MKKLILTALLTFAVASFGATSAFAAGVGYVDYAKVSTTYSLAKKYSAELDKKATAIKTYRQQQIEKIQSAKTDAERKSIAQAAEKQLVAKQQEYVTTANKYESELVAKVAAASEQVRVSKKLDIVIKKTIRITGGVDCTADVLKILK